MKTTSVPRILIQQAEKRLSATPGLVLLGPRQVGKTTLARAIAAHTPQSVFLDLQLPSDRAKLTNADVFLGEHRDHLVVMDEVQFMPDIFVQLRPEIDAHRKNGCF
jgi:uncharacterized protein